MVDHTKNQIGAYATHQNDTTDNREIDRRALVAGAVKLREAFDNGGKDMRMYEEAIRYNQKIWTMFQVALCDPENQLPQNLKMTLLNLSRYVDRTSFRAITEFMPQLLNSLMDINKIIAAGLAKKPAVAPQAQQAPVPGAVVASPPPPGTQSVMMSA